MEGVTRRTALAMGSVPVVAGVATYVTRGMWEGDRRPRFAPAEPARAAIQQRHLPNVSLVTHDGTRVRFYDDLVRGKSVVLTFVSSAAPAESSRVTRNLAAIQRLFGNRGGRDMFLYSIARNPERDSRAALGRWAIWSGAGPGWKFLTGRPADVEALRHGLGFGSDDPGEDANPAFSVGAVRYGTEPEMRWGHCQSQAEARVIAHSLLLDFGLGRADPDSPVAQKFGTGATPGGAPVWNCKLLLESVA
jgi:protein SCO1/2